MRKKRLLWWFLAALLLITPAVAQKKFIIFEKIGWVYPGAVVDLDFVHGNFYSYGFVPDISKYITTVRVSTNNTTVTDLLRTSPSGYPYKIYANNTIRVVPGIGIISELVRTNFLINSAAPANQTVSLAFGTYSLQVWGAAGNATMSTPVGSTASGCGTGTASQGNPLFVAILVAGTCNVTVSGAPNAFQLELHTGQVSLPTSLMVTGAALGFRGNEQYQFPVGSPVQTIAASGQGTLLCQITRPHSTSATSCFGVTTSTTDVFISTGTSGGPFISRSHGNVVITALDGGPSDPTIDKIWLTWDATGRCIIWNAGTPVCDSNTYAPTTTAFAFSLNGGSSPNVPGLRLTFWPGRRGTAEGLLVTR